MKSNYGNHLKKHCPVRNFFKILVQSTASGSEASVPVLWWLLHTDL